MTPLDPDASPWGLDDPRARYALDRDVLFLNHGSFGATPLAVLKAQSDLRLEMESDPVRFMVRILPDRLELARTSLAAFVGADPEDLVFVPNATFGVSAILQSLELGPGDELLTTSQAYGACRNALDILAARHGARVVVADIPFPLEDPSEILPPILAKVGPRTRLALIDHVTSVTALVLPIQAIVSALAERGVDTLVDGAHGPGMVPLDLDALGAAYYVGNGHKWLSAPKGAGLLHVRRDRQGGLQPPVISHGERQHRPGDPPFHIRFDWLGTADPTAALCVPVAIDYLGRALPGGWPALMERNRALALEGRRILCDALGIPLPAPAAMIGSLVSIPLPAPLPLPPGFEDGLQRHLYDAHRVEILAAPWPAAPRRAVRLSAHVYNHRGEYARFAEILPRALAELRERTHLERR